MPQIIYHMNVRPEDTDGAVELPLRITYQEVDTGLIGPWNVDRTYEFEWTRLEIGVRKRASDPYPVWLDVTECPSLQELVSIEYERKGSPLFDAFVADDEQQDIAARESARERV